MSTKSLPVTRAIPLSIVLVALAVAALAFASRGAVGKAAIEIEDPWMAAPANPEVAGVFMRIHNTGGAPDRLLGGQTDIAGIVEIHETVVDDEGRSQMRPLAEGLELPAGDTVFLEPGGYHVMLREVTAPPEDGDTVTLHLQFAEAGDLTVDVPVREPMVGGHGSHDESMDS